MTGPEHYTEAEAAQERAAKAADRGDLTEAALELRFAQVHATLAHAAATALYPLAVTAELGAWGVVAGTAAPPEGGER